MSPQCPNGCQDATWMPAWRPCQCAGTEGQGGHIRYDCSGCSYTYVPGCLTPDKRADSYRYVTPDPDD